MYTHQLKCQVVRISHSTAIIQRGVFKVRVDESDPTRSELEKEDEPVKQSLKFFWQKENWVHLLPSILKQGRVAAEELEFEESVTEDAQRESAKKKAAEMDKGEALLKPLLDDKAEGLERCWVFKVLGSKNELTDPSTLKRMSDTVFVAKSLVWPGFTFFFKDDYVFQLYVGSGQKYSPRGYFPQFTHSLQLEPVDPEVMHETAAPEKKSDEPGDATNPPA